MARDVDKPEQLHEEELDLAEPLVSLEGPEDERKRREKSIARLRLLWSQRGFLGRVMGVGLVAAILIAFLIPSQFTSAARLMPPDEGSGQGAAMLAALAGRAGGTLTSLATNALGVKTTGDLFIGVLKSDTVRDDVIQKFNLQKLYHDAYVEDARKDLTKQTGISEDAKSGIITVEVTDHNPRRSAAITQEYVNELNWVVNNLSTSSAHRERVFLDQRLDQVKSQLEGDEKQFSQFASQKGAIDIAEQGKAMVTAAATLQGQLIATESELEGLRQVYTDNNVRVRSLQARVNDLHAALEKIGGKGTDENSSAEDVYPSLRQLPLLGVEYADLLRRTKVQEAVFEALTQEDELAKVEEAKETPSVKVLDPPEVPEKKSYPPRLLFILLGPILGLVLGTSWIFSSSAWESVDPNDPRKLIARQVWTDIHAGWYKRNGSRRTRNGRTFRFWGRSGTKTNSVSEK
jgi:capsule polysaccharide export protein KpsE/RkpR